MTLAKRGSTLLLVAVTGAAGLFAGYSSASQPRMQSALGHLEAAEADLKDATADKGGHRQRALDYTRRAQKEVREGMRFDRRH